MALSEPSPANPLVDLGRKYQMGSQMQKREEGREMDQWLGLLTALPGDLGLIPSTHMAADNCP